jgi:hypothetical protein
MQVVKATDKPKIWKYPQTNEHKNNEKQQMVQKSEKSTRKEAHR